MALEKPPYQPNVENQTVEYGGQTWKGNPGEDWTLAGGGYGAIENVPSVQEYIKGQFAAEDPYLAALVERMKGREAPLDIYGRLETEAGLPELRGAATTLTKEISSIEDLLETIEPDIAKRTRESLVTEAQRRGMVTAGREPYLEKLGKFGTALGRVSEQIGTAERGIATKTELAMRGQELELEPYQLQYTVMVDRNARLTTGFTEDRQTQLDILWDKLERTRALEDREWELANQLGSEEREYIKALQTSAAQAGVTLKGTETIDEMLTLIGKAAREEILWERAQAGKPTETEKKAVAKRDLLKDAAGGMYLKDLQTKYGDKLSTSEIVELYTGVGYYGEPWEPYAKKILGVEEEKKKGMVVLPDGSIYFPE